jgi:hypothetical protein
VKLLKFDHYGTDHEGNEIKRKNADGIIGYETKHLCIIGGGMDYDEDFI